MEEPFRRPAHRDCIYVSSSHNDSLFDFCDCIVGTLCIIIIILNFCVVFSIGILLLKGQQPRSTYKYLGNISFIDMILGISKFFVTLYPHQFHNELICSLSLFTINTAALASNFSIGLIAIDRYLYILYGLHYHRYITTKRPNCMILSIWSMSAVFGCFSGFIWRSPMHGDVCWFMVLTPPKLALILPSLGIIPLIIILVLYSIILKNALNSTSRMNNNCSTVSSVGNQSNHDGGLRMFRGRIQITSNYADENPPSKIRSLGLPCCRIRSLEITPHFSENRWKAVQIVVCTTGTSFVIWFTYFVIFAYHAFSDLQCEKLSKILGKPMSLLSLCNSLMNPVIYAWFHAGFRKSVIKMYSMVKVKICRKKSTIKIHQTSSIKQNGQDNFDNQQELHV